MSAQTLARAATAQMNVPRIQSSPPGLHPEPDLRAKPWSVFVVDDYPIVSMGLELMLGQSDEFVICGSAGHAGEATALAVQLQPDLIIVDLIWSGYDGLQLLREMAKALPKAKVLVYSSLEERLYAQRTFQAGGRGYVMKSEGLRNLMDAMRTVVRGHVHASAAMTRVLLDRAVRRDGAPSACPLDGLSNGEMRVLRLMAADFTSARIALEMKISPKTVSSYKERLKDKLGVHSNRELEEYCKRCLSLGATSASAGSLP